MTRVDFYILSGAGAELRERFACRLAEKAYGSGYTVLLLAEAAEQAERLDGLLWTFRQGSFVPHARLEQREGEPVAVATDEHGGDDAVLLNLTDRLPDGSRGSKLGALRTVYIMVGALSPVAFGAVADRGYFDEGFFAIAAVSAAVVAFALAYVDY